MSAPGDPRRVVYLDVDGTLLGPEGSLLRDADGGFCDGAIRALELLHNAGVPVVLVSGRARPRLELTMRMLGADGVLAELGAVDADLPRPPGQTVYEAIAATGIPDLLLAREPGLEVHPLARSGREGSHVLWGRASADAATFVHDLSRGALRLADNGQLSADGAHVYHLLPADAGKAPAVARDIARRGADPAACLAIGDSLQDLDIGRVLGTVAIVANGAEADPDVARDAEWVTRASHGAGVLEAVATWLAGDAPRRGGRVRPTPARSVRGS